MKRFLYQLPDLSGIMAAFNRYAQILKLTSIFIIGLVAYCAQGLANGNRATSQLFSQDFTWSYYMGAYWFTSERWDMKFGEPEIREGVEYRPFNFVNSSYTPEPGSDFYVPYEASKYYPPCLIREEEGKVYGIIPKEFLAEEGVHGDNQYDDTREYMLYDFSAEVGDRYQTLSNFGEVIDVQVIGLDQIEVNGEMRRLQRVFYDNSYNGITFDVIEGIGIVEGGFFPYLNTIIYAGKPPKRVPGAGYDAYIKYLTDASGDVIYGTPYSSICKIVNGNYSWEYVSKQTTENGFKFILDSYTFENIRSYKLLKLGDWIHTSHSEWEGCVQNGKESVVRGSTVSLGEYVATFAQSVDRVYIVEHDFDTSEGALLHDEEEPGKVLYDYSYRAQKDQTFTLTGWYPPSAGESPLLPTIIDVDCFERDYSYYMLPGGASIIKVSPRIAGKDERKEEGSSSESRVLEYIAGVGNVGSGDMLSLEFSDSDTGSTYVYGKSFNRLLDENGNVLYAGKNVELPSFSGVTEIADVGTSISSIFDLFGREIAAPQPGTVYIRDGKKFVAK